MQYITIIKYTFVLILLVFLGACQESKPIKPVKPVTNSPPIIPVIKIPKKGAYTETSQVTEYIPFNRWIPWERNLDTFGFYRGVVILPKYVNFKRDVVPITFKIKSPKSVAQVSFDILGTGSKKPLFETTLTPSGKEDDWVLYTYQLDSKKLDTNNWPTELHARFFVKERMGATATFHYVQAEVVLSQIKQGRYVDEQLVFPAQFKQIRASGHYRVKCFLFTQDGHPIARSTSRGELGEKDSMDIVFDQKVIGPGLKNTKVHDCIIEKTDVSSRGALLTYGRVDEKAYRLNH